MRTWVLLALTGAATFALEACTPQAPLIRVTVALQGFSRGCVRVRAGPAGAPSAKSSEIVLDPTKQAGAVTVAVFPDPSWGPSVDLAAEAHEGDCAGPLASVDHQTVTVKPTLVEARLRLAAADADGDGFFARPGGSDCDDADPAVHPGAAEACNGRDDNCDGAVDEGFSVGLPCDAGACVGANACAPDGTARCDSNVRWYPDVDGDGRGQADAGGVQSCQAPGPGMAPNALDCNDRDPAVYGGAREICDGKDNDCSGAADEPFFVGQSCAGTACTGSYGCLADGGSECSGGAGTLVYLDSDQDGFAATGAQGAVVCGGVPAGYATVTGDCDDGNPRVHPGAPEICNGLDDDCSGRIDDGYPDAGSACNAGCATGAAACLPDGGSGCLVTYHPDVDRDGHGAAGGAITGACFPPGAPFAYDALDCDDADPFTFQGAKEICDGRDNDCDGVADDGNACPPDAGWIAKSDGNAAHDFAAVASVDAGAAFAAGATDTLVLAQPGTPSLVNDSSQCRSANWAAAWFDRLPGDRVYLCGSGGQCAVHARVGGACSSGTLDSSTQDVTGLVGFRDGGLEPTGLDVIGVQVGGGSFVWDGNIPGDDHSIGVVTAQLRAVHGASEATLFAVGTDTGAAEPRLFRWVSTVAGWADQNVQALPGVTRAPLNAVWIVHGALGYAVGENRSVLVWNGSAWAPMAGPTGGNGSLRGVVAWGRTSVFAVDDQIHQYDGTQWRTLSAGTGSQLTGIAGSSPGDLWAVSAFGWIAHWPSPPF